MAKNRSCMLCILLASLKTLISGFPEMKTPIELAEFTKPGSVAAIFVVAQRKANSWSAYYSDPRLAKHADKTKDLSKTKICKFFIIIFIYEPC